MSSDQFDLSTALSEFKNRSTSGYALGLHISFTTPAYFFQSYPKPWLEHYSHAGLLLQDPTVSWCFENVGHCRWSDMDDPGGVLDEGAKFGLNYGFSGATNLGDSHSMAGFARPDREFTDDEIACLMERFEAMHMSTIDQKALPATTVDQLKKMSIIVTHPGS